MTQNKAIFGGKNSRFELSTVRIQLPRIFVIPLALCVLLVFAGCQHPPKFSTDDAWHGVITIGDRSWNVETIGPGAKMLKWSRWQPDFPELYVIEMHDGEATGIHHTITHSLVVVDTASPEERVLLQEQIYSSIKRLSEDSGEAETWTHTTPYKLAKNSEGQPCILLGEKQARTVVLKQSPH